MAAIALTILAAVGATGAVLLLGADRKAPPRKTEAHAPITVSRPPIAKAAGGILGDPDAGVLNYLYATLSWLPGRRHYQLTITNISNLGVINSFQWYPPPGVRVVKVLGSSSGDCKLSGLSGFGGNQFKAVVLYPNILCDRLRLKPPSCTCKGDGGSMTVSFASSSDTNPLGGAVRVVSATPTLKIIPSY